LSDYSEKKEISSIRLHRLVGMRPSSISVQTLGKFQGLIRELLKQLD
jgi:hypothetical protein